jgi:cytochrome c biogenesis protein CcdA
VLSKTIFVRKIDPQFDIVTVEEDSMSKKTISLVAINLVAIILGVVVTLVSLTADLIGIGSYPGINWAQLTGTAIGLILILLGLRLRRLEGEQAIENEEAE